MPGVKTDLREAAYFFPLRIVQDGGVRVVIVPDVEGKPAIKAGIPGA